MILESGGNEDDREAATPYMGWKYSPRRLL